MKGINMKKLLIAALLAPMAAQADLPYTFQQGTPARASEVNANMQALDAAVGGAVGGIEIVTVEETAESIAGAVCPEGTVGISAACNCDTASGARNLGVLFACRIFDAGAAGGCFDYLYTSSKPHTNAIVSANCVRITDVDGNTITAKSRQDITPILDSLRATAAAAQQR